MCSIDEWPKLAKAPVCGRVVFHADDLGLNTATDAGILQAFTGGLLTSTSVLANGPSARVALKRVGECSKQWCHGHLDQSWRRSVLGDRREPFDIGIHLNLTQGRPLTEGRYPSELLDDQGRFPGVYRLFALLLGTRRKWKAELTAELAAQINWAIDQNVRPTHANGHQYIELLPYVAEIIANLMPTFSIEVVRLPIERRLYDTTLQSRRISAWGIAHVKRTFAFHFARHVRACNLRHADGFLGTVHAGRITMAVLSRRLNPTTTEPVIEIGMHPGAASDNCGRDRLTDGWSDPLAVHRPSERDVLCSDALIDLLMRRRLGLGRLSNLKSRC
jgi:chitin disaccharide deacetylase